eukprot:scaffold13368_cov75-Phaeocystis_antarctica.AAC.3
MPFFWCITRVMKTSCRQTARVSTMGRPHCAASRGLWLPSTSMHQARIILAVHGFEASVAQALALRQTTAHPEPERVVTETRAWAGQGALEGLLPRLRLRVALQS